MSLARAAAHLDETPAALRRRIERALQMMPDGTVQADLPGIRARKLGKLWKVHLADGWQIGDQ